MTTSGWAIYVLVAAIVSFVVLRLLAPVTATEWVTFYLATIVSGFIVGYYLSRRRRQRLHAEREQALMRVEYIPATVRSLDGGGVLSTGYVSVVRHGDEMMVVTWHDEIGSEPKPIDLPGHSELIVGPTEMGRKHPR